MTIAIDTGTDHLLARIEERVGVLTINRPEARNALSDELSPALRRKIKEFADDDRVGAVLLTGTGPAFCAGGDVKGMGGNKKATPLTPDQRALDLKQKQRTLTGALFALRKPTVAALPGPAAGAGLSIALACDVRFAARSAFVSTGYARVGLSGDYGMSWLLPRLIGPARARQYMYTAERIDADTCERIGLVNEVVDDDALWDTAFGFARAAASGPGKALALMKDNLDQAERGDLLQALDGEAERMMLSAATEDHKEAVRAFIEKRAPKFSSR